MFVGGGLVYGQCGYHSPYCYITPGQLPCDATDCEDISVIRCPNGIGGDARSRSRALSAGAWQNCVGSADQELFCTDTSEICAEETYYVIQGCEIKCSLFTVSVYKCKASTSGASWPCPD